MDEEERNDELTGSEEETEERDDTTPDEAHRIGEFEALRDGINELREAIAGLREMLTDIIANGGATIREGDEDEKEPEINLEDIPGVDDLDLSID